MTTPTPALVAKPFLKWAGGKQQLLSQYDPYFPSGMKRYLEPFIGGGAVFFHLWNTRRLPAHAFLFDTNAELINAYDMVKRQIKELITLLANHKHCHNHDYYYAIRNLDRQAVHLNDIERAARTIYLNKTCYNGLYRVNRNGQFNVPIGSYKDPTILHEDTLRAASAALQHAVLATQDFRAVAAFAQRGDLVYFDPPYHPVSKTASFTNYTAGSFRDDDQRDLARVFQQLTDKGCRCMLSNSHTPLVLELYQSFRIITVQANRAINSNTTARGSINEVLVLNY